MLTSLEFKMKKRGLAISNYLFGLVNKGNDRSIKAKKKYNYSISC